MMKKSSLFFSILLISTTLFLLSCGDENPLNPDEKNQRGTISGTVVDQFEKPLSGVSITTNKEGFNSNSIQDGTYSIPDIESDIYTLTYSKVGYFDTTMDTTIAIAKMAQIININMIMRKKTGTITGSVSDTAGNALSNVTVTLAPTVEGVGTEKSVNTGTDETFTIDKVDLGIYEIQCTHPTYTATSTPICTLSSEDYSDTVAVTMRYNGGQSGGIVNGILKGNSTQVKELGKWRVSVVGTELTASGRASDTLEASFTLSQVPPGENELLIDCDNFVTKRVNVTVVDGESIDVGMISLQDEISKGMKRTVNGLFDESYRASIDTVTVEVIGYGFDDWTPFPCLYNKLQGGFSGTIVVPEKGTQWRARAKAYAIRDGKMHKLGQSAEVPFTDVSGDIVFSNFTNPNNCVPEILGLKSEYNFAAGKDATVPFTIFDYDDSTHKVLYSYDGINYHNAEFDFGITVPVPDTAEIHMLVIIVEDEKNNRDTLVSSILAGLFNIVYENSFPIGRAFSVFEQNNGNHMIAGRCEVENHSYVMQLNSIGEKVWEKIYRNLQIKRLYPGPGDFYLMYGSVGSKYFITCYKGSEEVGFSHSVDTTWASTPTILGARMLDDGNIVYAEYKKTEEADTSIHTLSIVKVLTNGEEEWRCNIELENHYKFVNNTSNIPIFDNLFHFGKLPYCRIEPVEGGYAIGCLEKLILLNDEGEVQWEYKGESVLFTPMSDGFMSITTSSKCTLQKLSLEGKVEWNKNLNLADKEMVFDIQRAPDGNILMVGISYTDFNHDRQSWFAKISSNGDLISHFSNFPTTKGMNGVSFSVQATSDFAYLIGGEFYSRIWCYKISRWGTRPAIVEDNLDGIN